MPEVVSDIIVSSATVWNAPVGEGLPDENSVGAGVAWGGNWTQVGFTSEPLSVKYEFEEVEKMIEQSLAPVGRQKTGENLTLETVLAEFYMDGLQLGTGGTVTDTAAGAAQVGKEELDVGGEFGLDEKAWGFEGTYVDEDGDTFPVRMFVYKGTAMINGELEFGKESQLGIPLQIKALADLSKSVGQQLFKLQKVLEPTT